MRLKAISVPSKSAPAGIGVIHLRNILALPEKRPVILYGSGCCSVIEADLNDILLLCILLAKTRLQEKKTQSGAVNSA